MSKEFRPFADGADSIGIGDLTIEDAGDSVALYGSLTIEATHEGLVLAERLARITADMVTRLREMDLPDALPSPNVTSRSNPFDE
ncbi:hypothetical protein [Sphingomonas sp. 3-13AW]|uniref:hypothetical protein n=1 Tax=Sphingomonas sp. 3-13AW TaxID=3050450 RepID=UPI003BB4A4F3